VRARRLRTEEKELVERKIREIPPRKIANARVEGRLSTDQARQDKSGGRRYVFAICGILIENAPCEFHN
jgi:hypothetical protein